MHTKEPWRVDYKCTDEFGYKSEHDDQSFGMTIPIGRTFGDEYEANARRIVACVNACEGISNEHLEKMPVAEVFAIVKQQRDDLLAALKEAQCVISSINAGKANKLKVDDDDEPVYWQREEWVKWARDEVLPQINSAISKVEGKGDE